jgi:hypothetical protein
MTDSNKALIERINDMLNQPHSTSTLSFIDWTREVVRLLQEARDALAQHSPPREGREVCWLIERGQKYQQSPTVWWRGENIHDDAYQGRWTEVSQLAMRFKNQEQATAVAVLDVKHFYEITEHVFISDWDAADSARDEKEKR